MIPNETLQTVSVTGDTLSLGNFRMEEDTEARILVSLSDKMYSKKELAFVREYSTNAADAHIVSGKSISEIIVDLPTLENLNFRIRDFGTGLTQDQIVGVYCVMGKSTKRNSNEQNGMLGYGCKSGFAHADSFTVTSWTNGEKSIYQCIKGDSTKRHSVMLLSRSPSAEPSGIEISIPVKQSSIWTVHQEAADFYKHWPVIPTINNMAHNDKTRMESFRANPPTLQGEGWEIRPRSGGQASGVAYMGFVAYTLDWNVMFNRMSLTSQKRVLFELLQSNDVTLHFKMGEIQFVDSREHLDYTEFTLSALMERVESIFAKIKDSIQEKFNTAKSLWEAKKLYNAVFGTGTIEVERGEDTPEDTVNRIKILDGNLLKLETVFLGEFTWNGIQLRGNSFDDINCFDNATPTEVKTDSHDPIEPVMITYRKKKERTKVHRCSSEHNNTIRASDFVAVVLNDTGKKSNQSLVARYLIFNDGAVIRTVHILSFADATIKDNFYTKLNFATVPVLKMSDVLADAKTWHSANKASRSSGGGTGSRPMEYMDLESETIEDVSVPMRELEDGGLYIELGSGRRGSKQVIGANGCRYHRKSDTMEYLKTITKATGMDIDRVYIIPQKTKDTQWFNKAQKAGLWVNVWEFVKQNLTDTGIDVQALVDARAYDACSVICQESATKLAPLIREKNSYILKVMATVIAKEYTANEELITALSQMDLLSAVIGNVTPSLNYNDVKHNMRLQYPLLSHYNYNLENDSLDEDTAKEVAKYINAMDVYVELYGEEDAKAEAAKETETVEA